MPRATKSSAAATHGFPFEHDDFIVALLAESRVLRHVTASYADLGKLFVDAEVYMMASQCSLNKALEKLCGVLVERFGKSIHAKFWGIARQLCERRPRPETSRWRRPHPFAACMMTDIDVKVDARTGQAVYTPQTERWAFTPRTKVSPYLELADQRRLMNTQIVEAVFHHQVENGRAWPCVPDFHFIFLALTFAQRGASPDNYSAMRGSYVAFMAAQYELDDGKTTFAAFKGLRRWRSLPPDAVREIGLKCVFGWRTSPRHHQLWHFKRLVNEMSLHHMQSTVENGTFLLLLGVIQDHVFASIPPEDAALAVFVVLFKPHGNPPNNRQRFDISRVLLALQYPRSPYMEVLFPNQYRVPVETWAAMLA
jgi:hypothetical protein